MSELKSEQGFPSQLSAWMTRLGRFGCPYLSTRQHIGYAVVSFLLGVTYLKVLAVLDFQFSPVMLLFSLLGGLCLAVCVLNLIAIWTENH